MSTGKQWQFKVVLLGDGAVGKTSIREQYMGKGFTGSYLKTIGADFASKDITLGDYSIKLTIWDLAGQTAYAAVRSSFYTGANGAFLVFDLQDEQSLLNLRTWIDEARTHSKDQISSFVVLGNKADLVETRKVSNEYAHTILQRWAAELGINFWYGETSAKTGLNVADAFDVMSAKLLTNKGVQINEEEVSGGKLVLVTPMGVKGAQAPSGEAAVPAAEIQELKDQIKQLDEKLQKLAMVVKTLVSKVSQLEKQ